jgi:hypothetical protein
MSDKSNILTTPTDIESCIKLTVSDKIGVVRKGEFVCSGVPFAQGFLQPQDPVVILSNGTPIPAQAKVLGKWSDGSVKWLLVQFPADCPANSSQEYCLVKGKTFATKSPLIIKDEENQIIIDTGAIIATVPKSRLTMLGDVCLKDNGDSFPVLMTGTPMSFLLEDGCEYDSTNFKPESVTVEENGPLLATIRVIGWIDDPKQNHLYKLDTRLRFYAEQSYIQAEYTFVCLGQPSLHHIKEIAINVRPSLGDKEYFVLPDEAEPFSGILSAEDKAILSVDADMNCQIGLNDEQKNADKHIDGWSALFGEKLSLGLAIKDFWHLCPKAIELSHDYMKLALWSHKDWKILNLGRTRAKTHHVLYDFSKKEDAELDRIRAFQSPLIADTQPDYFCNTEVFGLLSTSGAKETQEYDKKVEQCFDILQTQRETMPRENGMLHYGDYYHGGYGNNLTRGDLEYDTGHACFLLYARSGMRKYFDFAVACNQHFIDIDINQETGDQRFHGYSEAAENHEAVTTSMEWGHLFVDCCADAYYLTGDERSLESLKMIANRVATIADGEGYEKIRSIFAGAERQLGWPLDVLCRAYEVTGEEKYLKSATKVVDYIKLYAKDPISAYEDGVWWRSWMMDGCKVFMTGELHDGLAAYYNITHDKELRYVIITSLNWLIDHMWNPQTDGFMYEFNAMNRQHRIAGMAGLNMLIVDAFRFGYQITGDRRYLSIATRSFWERVREMETELDGKQFSIDARTSPHTAAYFYKEHITTDNLPPSPQPIFAPRLVTVLGRPKSDVLLAAKFDGDLSCETPEGRIIGHAVGNIDFVSGKHGKSLSVGKKGYVWFPAPPDMLRQSGSIEFWVKLHSSRNKNNPNQQAIFYIEGQNPIIDSLEACAIYNELRIRMKDSVGHLHGTAEGEISHWEKDEWHHIIVTWDNERVRLYLDGNDQIRQDEGKYAGDGVIRLPSGQQTRINLGWRIGNWYCDCDIDDLVIYNRALNPDEITAKY